MAKKVFDTRDGVSRFNRKQPIPKKQRRAKMTDMENAPIIRTATGYEKDYGALSHRMVWDEYGAYVGQWQLNCLDMDPDAPTELFFRATGNQAGEFGLTQEEMDSAEESEFSND